MNKKRWFYLLMAAWFSSMALSAGAQNSPNKPDTSDTTDSSNKKAGSVYLPVEKKPKLDRSGEPQEGKASYYGEYFFGRKMADGTPMDPDAPIAASRTLPLGTIVEVTNLENGKKEVVEIRDRGPYIEGRIIDLTPKTAESLGMLEQGVARVIVTPLEVPQADGTVSTGSGAAREASAAE